MAERFLVPIDFSPHAEQALQTAIELAGALQARLILMHVRSDTSLNLLSYMAEAEAEARQALELYAERVRDAALEVEIRLVHGSPWREIVAAASDLKATLIVMGTHGRTGLTRSIMGSVAERVLRAARCAVLVSPPSVPPPA